MTESCLDQRVDGSVVGTTSSFYYAMPSNLAFTVDGNKALGFWLGAYKLRMQYFPDVDVIQACDAEDGRGQYIYGMCTMAGRHHSLNYTFSLIPLRLQLTTISIVKSYHEQCN
jgi:hypothetical protein